jgi:integrase
MIADLRLRGLSDRTERLYLCMVRVFAKHFWQCPSELDTEHVRAFLLHLRQLGRSDSTLKVYWAALRFLYAVTLRRPGVMADVPRPRVRRRDASPALTIVEVVALLDAARPFDRTMLSLMYACGLRLSETCALQVEDVDARAGLLHVRRDTKGGKTRATRLSPAVLKMLREHWRTHGLTGPFLFPSSRMRAPAKPDPKTPWNGRSIPASTFGMRFRKIREKAALRRHVTLHDLRRAHATHLMDAGVGLRIIQTLLGHGKPETTALYTSVSADLIKRTPCPLTLLGLPEPELPEPHE